MYSRLLSVTVWVVLAGACTSEQHTASSEFDLPRHELIFARHGDKSRQDYDIWRMCGDGSQLASLVTEPGTQIQVAVSPDGKEFIYASRINGQWELLREKFDGGDAVVVASHTADDSQPAWSPNGEQIVFSSKRDSNRAQLYLLKLASGEITRLTQNEHHDSGATFSPDGARVIFTRYVQAPGSEQRSGSGEIFSLSLEDGSETQLTKLGGYNGDVGFSPDGALIAFHRVADGRAEIWLANNDGSDPRSITDTVIDEYTPEWSPDGAWLAITAGSGNDSMGTFDIWLLRPDGSERLLLNDAPNTEAWHVWRPGEHYCR